MNNNIRKTCVIVQSLSFIEIAFILHDIYISDMLAMSDSADSILDYLEGTGTYYIHSEATENYDEEKKAYEFSTNKVLRIFV